MDFGKWRHIKRQQNTVVEWVAMRPILDMCRQTERPAGSGLCGRYFGNRRCHSRVRKMDSRLGGGVLSTGTGVEKVAERRKMKGTCRNNV